MPASSPAGRSPATDAAAALLARLVELGVGHIVVSPGSRSQALALAAADLESRGLVRLHVRIDERSATTYCTPRRRANASVVGQ